MTDEQAKHCESIIARLAELMRTKYAAGAAEHAGNLFDLAPVRLVDEALAEIADLGAYLLTLKDQLTRRVELGRLWSEVTDEMSRAESLHGNLPLPDGFFRALAILSEEVGEVARAMLVLRRESPDVQAAPAAAKEAVVSELIQVMATSALLIEWLRRGI